MTIEYALTRTEIARAFLQSLMGSSRYRTIVFLYSVAIGVLVLVPRAAASQSIKIRDVMISVAWAAGTPVFMSLWVFVRGKTAKRTLTLSPEGISTKIGSLKGEVPWRSVGVVTDTNAFVLIAKVSGNAFFIPNRAFSGSDQRALFLAEINRWMHSYPRPLTSNNPR